MKKQQTSRKMDDISCILEPTHNGGGLYLGNFEAASDSYILHKYQIKAVLTVCPQTIPTTTLLYHLNIPADDVDSYPLIQHFDETFNFIDKAISRTNVLVHCQAGISRSAAIVIAYMVRKLHIGVRECLQILETKRWQVFPNNGFLKQLGKFERQIFEELATKQIRDNDISSSYKRENEYPYKRESEYPYRNEINSYKVGKSAEPYRMQTETKYTRNYDLKKESEEILRTIQRLKESNKQIYVANRQDTMNKYYRY